jgi:hypothetical protein
MPKLAKFVTPHTRCCMMPIDKLIPNPGKQSDYRGTENYQRNSDERIPLFLWLLSVPLYPSSVIFLDSV